MRYRKELQDKSRIECSTGHSTPAYLSSILNRTEVWIGNRDLPSENAKEVLSKLQHICAGMVCNEPPLRVKNSKHLLKVYGGVMARRIPPSYPIWNSFDKS